MMKSWRCDPYLWIHLAGLATVPLWIDLCLLGLAVETPTLPGLEYGFIVALGVLPVLVMQLRRPFYIFSLPGLALRPGSLKTDQLRLLTQLRRWRVRLGALPVSIFLVWVLVNLYPLAFLAREITPFGDWGRMGGVAIAALGFFLANLFLQVPVAVLQVMATPDRRMQTVVPYPIDQIATTFTWFGLSVDKILPDLVPSPIEASIMSVVEPLAESLDDLDPRVDTSQTLPSQSMFQSMHSPTVLHPELTEHEPDLEPTPRADGSEHKLTEGQAEASSQPHHPEIDNVSEVEALGKDGEMAILPRVPVDI
jgi:hypothetical protein